MRRIGVWVVMGVLWASLGAAAWAEGIHEGVTLYLPLDGDAEPRLAGGMRAIQAEAVTYVEGKAGKAAVVATKGIGVPGAGSFSRPVGSLAFWVRLDWSPADPGNRSLIGCDNFVLHYQADKSTLFFMTGKTKPQEGYRWDYGTATRKLREWKPGEWHHVAATWDSATGRKALYLDGAAVSTHTTEWIRSDPYYDKKPVVLGAPDAPGAYDELIFWSRVLAPEEVARLAAQPEAVARELQERLPRPAPEKRWPVAFGLAAMPNDRAPETIVEPGASVALRIPVKNEGPEAWRGEVTLTLLDFREKPRATEKVALSLAAGESKEIPVAFRAPERGIFKVSVRLRHEGADWERDVASFAAWPAPVGLPNPDSYFGSHVHSWGDGASAQAERLGLAWNRTHDMNQGTWWSHVQPEPGEFQWKGDANIERTFRHRMQLLGQFFVTPYWAVASGPMPRKSGYGSGYFAMPDLQAFRAYVKATVSRYKDRIRFWEIWNEPEVSMFWQGSPEEFAELCKAAYGAAKEADPTCTVLQAGYTCPAWKWHEKAAEAGALTAADGLTIHFYYGAEKEPEELAESFRATIEHFQDLARRFAGGRNLPVWNSEGGSGDTTWLRGYESPDLPPVSVRAPLNWRAAAIRQVQSEAILQGLGVVRSFQYLWHPQKPGDIQGLTCIDMTNAPKPKLMARTAMAAQVEGAAYAAAVRRDEGRLWAHIYQEPKGGSVVLWWAGREGEVRVSADWPAKPGKLVDLMGNDRPVPEAVTVTEEPSYVHVPAPADAVVEALRRAKVAVVREPAPLAQPADASAEGPAVPRLPDYAAPAENPAGVFFVDLRAHANMGFADDRAGDGEGGWADEGPLNCLHSMPVGRQSFYGVPFDVIDPKANAGKSIITLRRRSVTPRHPARVDGIAVGGRRVRCLYFLHAAAWGVPGTVGRYVVRYADGKSVESPLVVGENTHNWWNGFAEGEQSRPVPVRVTETADGKPAWRYVRVWEWQNPRRDVPVASLDFVSAEGAQTPILLAVTGVQ